MEVRKGYKQTEIGVIPEDWEVFTLDKLSSRIGDGIHSTPKYTDSSDYFFVNGNNLKEGKIIISSETKMVSELEFNLHKRGIDNSTLLFSINGTIGNIAYYNNEKIVLGKSAAYINVNNKLEKKLLFQILQTKFVNEYFDNELTGSTIKNLGLGSIRNTPVPLPYIKSEQTAIATALNDADALITNLEKIIEKKRAIKQGAMQKLLKPKEGWETKTLGEIGECVIGLTYRPDNVKESGLLVMRSSNIQNNALSYGNNVFVDVEVSEKLTLKENDILICVRNGSRDLIGKCALIKGQAVGETFGAFMSVFRSPFNEFIFNLFQSNIIKKQIDENLGATINQITNKSLNSFEIPFPTIEEQSVISNILNDMDAEITALEQKLGNYKLIKQGMMQELLTGRIRLV